MKQTFCCVGKVYTKIPISFKFPGIKKKTILCLIGTCQTFTRPAKKKT